MNARINFNVFYTLILFIALFIEYTYTQSYDQVKISTIQVSKGIYMLIGSGGNIGISTGEDGILLIDSQFPELNEKIRSVIAEIDSGEIRYLLNTNWHYDHCKGNAHFAEKGAIIIGHTKTREHMKVEQYHPFFDLRISASPEIALPVVTIDDSMTLYFNDDEIKVLHLENAHSDADLVFYFRKANVIHVGDICFVGSYPFIDVPHGGSIDGLILAIEKILEIINEETKIIPGHGQLIGQKELIEYKDMLMKIRNSVKHQIDKGKTLKEIIASKPTVDFDEGKAEWMPGDGLVQILFNDLSRK